LVTQDPALVFEPPLVSAKHGGGFLWSGDQAEAGEDGERRLRVAVGGRSASTSPIAVCAFVKLLRIFAGIDDEPGMV